jgi:hypothetical protein
MTAARTLNAHEVGTGRSAAAVLPGNSMHCWQPVVQQLWSYVGQQQPAAHMAALTAPTHNASGASTRRTCLCVCAVLANAAPMLGC